MPLKLTDVEFISLWKDLRSPTTFAKQAGMSLAAVHQRRRTLEARYNINLEVDNPRTIAYSHFSQVEYHANHQLGIENGTVIVGSDAHFWPMIRTTAFKGIVKFIKEMKPKAVIMNGDVLDGAAISRHPRIGWEKVPGVVEELEACKTNLEEIESAAGRAKLIWPLGNHCGRFASRLASAAPEYANVHGFQLKDHFPAWTPCWAAWVNENICVKHRYKGGIHATHNNTVNAGKSMVTGHLHSLKVTPFSDYNGTRFGVDCGTLAEPQGPQFVNYTEAGPLNWRSGFAVLTIHKGRLLWPELVHAFEEGKVEFRGQVIEV